MENNEEKVFQQADIDALQAAWTEERTALERRLSESQEAIKQQTVKHAFYTKAAATGITNPEGLVKFIDFSATTLGENGDVQGLDEIIESFAAAMPTKPRTIGEPSNFAQGDRALQSAVQAAAEKARATGRFEDMAAYTELKHKLSGGN